MDKCFEKLPKEYYKVEARVCGGMARSTTHKVQYSEGEAYSLALVSDTLNAENIGKQFEKIREENADLKERSLALKAMLKTLSGSHKFSFVLIDDSTKRVCAAATQYSAPLSFGHSKEGMLILFCGAGGLSVATHWPLNEQEVTQCAVNGAAARRRSVDMRERPSPREDSRSSMDGRRSTDGRRSIDGRPSAGAVFTSEVGWVDPGAAVPVEFAHDKIVLTHLPVGRFVYGHAYLQPYEFTSFWSSAQSNRAGVPERAFHSGNDWSKDNSKRRDSMDQPGSGSNSRRSSLDERRSKWEATNSKCDTEDSWKKPAAVLPPKSPTKEQQRSIETSMENLSIEKLGDIGKDKKKKGFGAKIRRNLSLERLKDAFGMNKEKS